MNSPTLAVWLSIAALGVSVLAALFTGWQALAASQSTRIERQRHHDERMPKFTARIEKSELDECLILKLDTPWELSKINIEPVAGTFIRLHKPFPQPIRQRGYKQGDCTSITFAPLALGPEIRFKADCFAGKEHWEVRMSVDLPDRLPPNQSGPHYV